MRLGDPKRRNMYSSNALATDIVPIELIALAIPNPVQ